MPFDFDNLAPHDREVCKRLADHYAVTELELLCDQSLAVVRASLRELKAYEEAIKAGHEPKPFRISLNVAQRHSRTLADLILERRNAHLCFYNDCNEELVEQSPFKDDVVARRHGHLANYDLIEVKPSRRRSARPRAGGGQSAAGSRSDSAQAEPRAKAEANTPEDTGVEPSKEVRRAYTDWVEAYEAWHKKGDDNVEMPEFPPDLFQSVKELAQKNPRYAESYTQAVTYNRQRKQQLKRLRRIERHTKQAQRGADQATS